MRPKILVVIKGMGVGGAEKLISEGARYWDTRSFEYRVSYLLAHKNALIGELENYGIAVNCFGSRRGLSASAVRRLRRLCSQSDLIHAHLPITGTMARLLAGGKPVVYTEHNVPSSYRLVTRLLNRSTYGMNTCSVAVSDAVADQTKNYPGRWKRIIANGVGPLASTTSREQVRSALELGEKARLVVHVGNIRPGKGHDALVETVLQLASTHPEVSFVSIGSEKIPGDLQRLRSRVRDLNLDDRLRFLGPRRDAIDFISAADVVINPSEVEGLPVAVLEALSLGRPVVATDVGGVSSVVIEGETGYLVAAGDTKALANRVGDLVGDSSERERMGRNGKQLMERNHSLADMVTQYETLYREVLDA